MIMIGANYTAIAGLRGNSNLVSYESLETILSRHNSLSYSLAGAVDIGPASGARCFRLYSCKYLRHGCFNVNRDSMVPSAFKVGERRQGFFAAFIAGVFTGR